MKLSKIVASVILASALLLATSPVAFAGGPVQQTPPDTITLNTYVVSLVNSNAQQAQGQIPQQAEGPAPCLNVASHVPDMIEIQTYK